jgi:hypothetical protein
VAKSRVSYSPERYEEDQTKGLFAITKSTMEHLSIRLSEVSMLDDSV